jgi:hypothetical protein
VIGSPITGSQVIGHQITSPWGTCSQSTGSQTTTRSYSSGTQSSGDGVEEEDSPPHEATSEKRKPKWIQDTLKEARGSMGNPRNVVKESKPPERFCSYLSMVSNINDSEISTFEEEADQRVWKDSMVEEYNSNMKNDVWDVFPRLEGNSVVTSRWLYKIKHVADGSIDKYKDRFVVGGFSQVEGVCYDETFALIARYIRLGK